jgi:regulator of sigma E protease
MQVALVLLGLSLLVVWHELGHVVVSRLLGLAITDVSFGFGPTLGSKVWKGVRWRLGLIPFGGFVRVAQLSLEADEPGRFRPRSIVARLLALGAGPAANFLLAALLITTAAWLWGQPTGEVSGLEVTQVSAHAASAGLRVGDQLQSVHAVPVRSVHDLNAAASDSQGEPVIVRVRRADDTIELTMRPIRANQRWGLGARYVARTETRRATLAQALAIGAAYPVQQSARLLRNASMMFVPSSGVHPVGPVGLAERVSHSGDWRGARVLSFAALLSVVVGLFNLLPVPGLDGGRLVLEAVESARRRRVPIRVAMVVQVVGTLVLLGLWVVLSLSEVASSRG